MKHYYRVSRSNRRRKINGNQKYNENELGYKDINLSLSFIARKLIAFIYLIYSFMCLLSASILIFYLVMFFNLYVLVLIFVLVSFFFFFAISSYKTFKRIMADKKVYQYGLVIVVLSTLLGLVASVITIISAINAIL